MTRSVAEWIGRNDDEPIPPRVRARVFLKFDGICAHCGNKITTTQWRCDHRISLINGGQHRESNLQPLHESCDKVKTKSDLRTKKVLTKKIYKRLGIKARKSRPIPGSRTSGWKKTFNNGWVRR